MKPLKITPILICISFILCLATLVEAQQPTNATKVNYEIRWEGWRLKTNAGGCSFGANEDQNDETDAACSVGDEWVFEMSVQPSDNDDSQSRNTKSGVNETNKYYGVNSNIHTRMDKSVTSVDLIAASWEDDNGINSGYGGGDDFYGNATQTNTFGSTTWPCSYHDFYPTLGGSNNIGFFQSVWRFHKGNDIANALTFGALTNGNYNHKNTAWVAPSNASTSMGYENEYSSNGLDTYAEVVYTFSLSACKKVSISNDYNVSTVSFYLFELNGTSLGPLIGESAGRFFPNPVLNIDFLEAGSYVIVAEHDFNPSNTAVFSEFDLQIDVSNPPITNAGVIELVGPTAIPINTNHPGKLRLTTDPTNFESDQWQRKTTSTSWEDISGATSHEYNLPVLGNTFQYRHAAIDGCGGRKFSNEIEVQALPLNGNVEGHVYTPSGAPNGVQDITVTITNTSAIEGGPSAYGVTYQDVTDNQGKYDIQGFYVGPDLKDWIVTPTFPNHDFTPDDITVTLGHADPSEINVNFIDNTSFSYTGKVKYNFNSTNCGLPGANIKLNGVFKTYTDANGDYSISIPQIGTHTISVEYENHNFVQSSITEYINEDKINKDFVATTMRSVNLNLLAGCSKFAGTADIQLIDSSACFNQTYTTSGSGNLQVNLPAKTYTVNVVGFNPISTSPLFSEAAVTSYFAPFNLRFDLSNADTTIELIFHPDPQIEVANIPALPDCGYTFPVVDQFSSIPLSIRLWDYLPGVLSVNDNGCRLDTGSLLVNDYVGSADDDPVINNYGLTSADFTYLLTPGSPALASPYTKELQFIASDIEGRQTFFTTSMLIEGFRSRASTFTTVSPQVPLFILRDPPGDMSFSEIIQNTEVEKSFTTSTSVGGSFKAWAKAIMDVEGPDGSNSKGWGEIGGSIEIGRENVSSTESVTTTSFTQSFSTASDQDPASIYEEGDVYVGSAFNIKYGVNDIIRFDPNRCEVKRDKKLMINPDTFQTTYVYTHNFIRDNIIPVLRDRLARGVVHPDSVKFFEDQAAIWEQTIQRNIDLKREANYTNNYSFNGGSGAISESSTTTSSENVSYEWTANLDVEVAAELGLVLGGTGAAGGFETHFRFNWGEGESTTTSTSLETNFTLDDDNANDVYSVDVGKDKVYATPVFKTVSANTACPYQPGTAPRYAASLDVDQSLHNNVDPNDDIVLTFTITNQSQSEEDLYYVMSFNNASNPDGALIDGSPNPGLNWSFSDPITYEGTVQQTVTIQRGAGNVYAYEGLEFRVYPSCNEINGDFVSPVASQKVSIYYTTPCTDVTLSAPDQNWVSSTTTDKKLAIHITDYIKSNMDALSIQYTEAGKNSWSQAINVPINTLPNNSTIGKMRNWNTTNIPDGAYDIRAKITCNSDVIYTNRITGIVDQNYPLVYGRPSPQNHEITDAEDVLLMTFNEDVNCTLLNETNVRVVNLLTGLEIEKTIFCDNRQLLIQPNVDLIDLTPAPYRLLVTDVEDLYGNVNPDSLIWDFTVGEYTENTCDESTIFYVDQSATMGKRLGTTWEDAYVDLRDALENACPTSSIYVAEGVYHPWDSIQTVDVLGNVIVDLDTVDTEGIFFELTHSYDIYGGFPSGGSELFERNPAQYSTILSGDKNQNNSPDAGDAHTIAVAYTDITSNVDGLIFENAYADGVANVDRYGAGIIDYSDAQFSNCIFRNLHAIGSTSSGVGAAYIKFSGNSVMVNCLFHDNYSTQSGGAISCEAGSIEAINCTFAQNNADGRGGAIHMWIGSFHAKNSVFAENTSPDNPDINEDGIGILNITNCAFDGALPTDISGTVSNTLTTTDPGFMGSGLNDFKLSATSPVIENGMNNLIPASISVDLSNKSRIVDNSFSGDPIVDMGAHEYSACAGITPNTKLKVDATATPGQSGVTWSTAIPSLSRALTIAEACDVERIYVAEGTYMPDPTYFTASRDARFIFHDDLEVYGGFPTGGSSINDRNWELNETILSGDIGVTNDHTDNAYTVVDIQQKNGAIKLDGFIIEHGNADATTLTHRRRGGGIHLRADGVNKMLKPTIKNCIIKNNTAIEGGGIAIVAATAAVSKATIENCMILNNQATNGGGIYEFSKFDHALVNTNMINTVIANNSASMNGGGIYAVADDKGQISSKLVNVTIVDNLSDDDNNASGEGNGLASNSILEGNVYHGIVNSVIQQGMNGSSTDLISHLDSMATSRLSFSVYEDDNQDGIINLPSHMTNAGGNSDDLADFINTSENNYRLKYGSVGVDFGKNNQNNLLTDLAGSNRIIGDKIDAGAYEFNFEFPCGVYNNLTIADNPIEASIYRADGTITSTGKVTDASGGHVEFRSESQIILQSQFEVKFGQTFDAIIENPCVD